jgi:hypothetical protein
MTWLCRSNGEGEPNEVGGAWRWLGFTTRVTRKGATHGPLSNATFTENILWNRCYGLTWNVIRALQPLESREGQDLHQPIHSTSVRKVCPCVLRRNNSVRPGLPWSTLFVTLASITCVYNPCRIFRRNKSITTKHGTIEALLPQRRDCCIG